jgi:hypothetical protein
MASSRQANIRSASPGTASIEAACAWSFVQTLPLAAIGQAVVARRGETRRADSACADLVGPCTLRVYNMSAL